MLDFLRKTRVGRVVTLASPGSEVGLEEIELRPQAGEGGWSGNESEGEGGPGPP